MKKIKINLSKDSINKARKELAEYKVWIEIKSQRLIEELAKIGITEAKIRFSFAEYDGNNDVNIYAEPTDTGYKIIAEGQSVCFIEFGTGVYYNPSEPYPKQRPKGIVGIGEYGKGNGKKQGWYYSNENKKSNFTRGNIANMPMWYATKEMQENIMKIAKEVFAK